MILTACIDDRGGMLFNKRRLSRDRLLLQNLLEEAAGRAVWMNAYSRKLFVPPPENLRCAEDFPRRAGPGELCFFENLDPAPWVEKAEEIVLYHWNRVYPSDLRFAMPPGGWTLFRREEFPGSSHERITKEVFVRSER